jgi:TRAP transporter 4TM/12TM fusion protein
MEPTEPNRPQLDKEKGERMEEGLKRKLAKPFAPLVSLLAVGLSLFEMDAARTMSYPPQVHRSIFLTLTLVIIFFIYPARKASPRKRPSLLDALWIGLSLATGIYILLEYRDFGDRAGDPNTLDVVFGVVTLLLVLESMRRTLGYILVVICGFFLVFSYFGPYFPSIFRHRGFTIEDIASYMYTTTNGIYGIALNVAATYIFFYILMGLVLFHLGAGDFLVELTRTLTGRLKAGVAKTITFVGMIIGMLVGNPAADAVTVGTLVFPLANKVGYNRIFTASLAAVAASGGALSPPVMGSVAFIMSEFTRIPYWKICVTAIVPTLLYYFTLYLISDFQARRQNVDLVRDPNLPSFFGVLKTGFYHVIPVIVLMYYLFYRLASPLLAAYYTILATVVVALVEKLIRSPRGFWSLGRALIAAFDKTARNSLVLTSLCAGAGIITGTLALTGFGFKFSSIVLTLAGGNLFLVLLYTGIAAYILGMGMPIAAVYIILYVLVAPALEKAGLSVLVANFYILYFSVFAAITPPVAIAAYATAALNEVDPMRTGYYAMRLAIVLYLLPFLFVATPELLLIGEPAAIAVRVIFVGLGVYALVAAIEGWCRGRLTVAVRMGLAFSSALFLPEHHQLWGGHIARSGSLHSPTPERDRPVRRARRALRGEALSRKDSLGRV